MVADLKPLVDRKSAKTEWGILNDQPCKHIKEIGEECGCIDISLD